MKSLSEKQTFTEATSIPRIHRSFLIVIPALALYQNKDTFQVLHNFRLLWLINSTSGKFNHASIFVFIFVSQPLSAVMMTYSESTYSRAIK